MRDTSPDSEGEKKSITLTGIFGVSHSITAKVWAKYRETRQRVHALGKELSKSTENLAPFPGLVKLKAVTMTVGKGIEYYAVRWPKEKWLVRKEVSTEEATDNQK